MERKKNSRRALGVLMSGIILCTSSCTLKSDFKEKSSAIGDMPKEISIFMTKLETVGKGMTDYNDVLGFQMMEEATGCHVNWTSPPVNVASEKFDLMIAQGKYTDAIVYSWGGNAGNAQVYAEDGVILPLTDMVQECMPNFMKWCEENPEYAKKIRNLNDGEIYFIPYIRADEKLNIFLGPQIRADWLEKLGLETPENAEELYNVLKAFKTMDPNGNGKADEIPMSGVGYSHTLGLTALLWMFNTAEGFYINNGKVEFGALTEEFKEGLSYIAKLYSEGLIDPDYILQDRAKMEEKVINDTVGFIYSFQPTKIMNAIPQNGSAFRLEGIKHLKNSDGIRKVYLSNYADNVLSTGLAITSSNPNPKGTLRWLDWVYSEEGNIAMNFGREGDTYIMKDGKPVFTDKILNNPDGLSTREAFLRYSGANATTDFPVLQSWDSYSQSLSEEGIEAIETWAVDIDISGIMPKLSLGVKDEILVRDIMKQVSAYTGDMIDKVIMGKKNIDEWDTVVETIKCMKVETAINIYQKAYDKYLGL